MENSKKKGGIIAIIIAIILAIGGLIGWLVYDKTVGEENREQETVQALLKNIFGKSWEDETSLQSDYRLVWVGATDGYSTWGNTLDIDENGNCTIKYFTGNEENYVRGTFTIGEFKAKETFPASTRYEFTVLNDTAGVVKFELQTNNTIHIYTE